MQEPGTNGNWSSAPIFDLQEMCVLGLLGTSNLLLSVSRLMYLPVSIRSTQVLTRTMLEIGSRNHWLLDPAISTRERVIRAVLEAIHSTQQDLQAAAKFEDARYIKGPQQLADAAVRWARDLDLAVKREKSGREMLADYRRPTSSALTQQFVQAVGGQKGSALYGYLSAATHGQPFHLVRLGGERLEILDSSLSDATSQLTLAVQIMKVVHIRYAQYLGKSSRARVRPYQDALRSLRERSDRSIIVGTL